MNEDQKKWLLYLQEKGIKFEIFHPDYGWENGSYTLRFCGDPDTYRIHAQPIPDIPDWRELCREAQSKGVRFEIKTIDGGWSGGHKWSFDCDINEYRIPEQPLPEWREEMTEETKPDPREEIPHREQQIQWHEDWLHHLRTGEPMREWEVNYEDEGYWKPLVPSNVSWSDCHKYRRKPRTVKYWHCVAIGVFDENTVGTETIILRSVSSRDDLMREINCAKQADQYAKFSPITETTVEIED